MVVNELRNFGIKNPKKLVIDQLRYSLQDKVDILVNTASIRDFFFPTNHFLIPGFFKPFNFDRNRNEEGILLFIRKDRPCKKSTQHEHPDDIEKTFVNINLRKTKLFLQQVIHLLQQKDISMHKLEKP